MHVASTADGGVTSRMLMLDTHSCAEFKILIDDQSGCFLFKGQLG
jgi:hypothetical protein